MMVRFNSVEEFLAELAADVELVERKIVRVTNLFRQKSPSFHDVTVVASAIVRSHIVRLDRLVGAVMDTRDLTESDREVRARADGILTEIELKVQKMGLNARAGIYEQ